MAEGVSESIRRRLRGVVVCDRADKTVRVRVERSVKHALYKKVRRQFKHIQVHDGDNTCGVGDFVVVEESPRFSKAKAWRVVERTPVGSKLS